MEYFMAKTKKQEEKQEVILRKKVAPVRVRKLTIAQKFDNFWIKAVKKYNLKSELKMAIWEHLKSYGFDSEDSFLDGLKHFGLKIK
jgi:hypothetical protein